MAVGGIGVPHIISGSHFLTLLHTYLGGARVISAYQPQLYGGCLVSSFSPPWAVGDLKAVVQLLYLLLSTHFQTTWSTSPDRPRRQAEVTNPWG